MALSLDDKLLGEKVHYYCSSSEEDNDNDDEDDLDEDRKGSTSATSSIKESAAWSNAGHQAENNGIVTNVRLLEIVVLL